MQRLPVMLMRWPLVPRLLFSRLSSSCPSTFDPLDKQWPITCTFDSECAYALFKRVEDKWRPLVRDPRPVIHNNNNNNNQTTDSITSIANTSSSDPTYVLSMFPYPSGSLHLGHVKVYTTSDVVTRFLRLAGHETVTPIGWDSFGLPAENAAFERDLSPKDWTHDNMRHMRHQLDSLCLAVDWRPATSDPEFYKWTQWLVTQLLHHNLLYRTKAEVNWDPEDGTVLADHQVDDEGRSWRSGAVVQKRLLSQWFVKTSAFVHDLWTEDGVSRGSDGVHMHMIHDIQRNFMGPMDGRVFYLQSVAGDVVPLFVHTSPAVFLNDDVCVIISPDHWMSGEADKQFILNPFTGKKMPVRVSKDITSKWKAGISSHLPVDENKMQIIEQVLQKDKSIGGYRGCSQFTDWLISRQRYWGTPFPVIHCSSCGPVPVPPSDLPVLLPHVHDFQALKSKTKLQDKDKEVTSKLQELAPKEWLSCPCPKCGSRDARRETDTLDTFVDSCWYYLRFATSGPKDAAFDRDFWSRSRVFSYTGGPEHATGHLLTSRLMYQFVRRLGLVTNKWSEPYAKFLVQGIVNGRTFEDESTGAYMSQEEGERRLKQDKSSVRLSYQKMSKSKYNGVDPLHLISCYGADATRVTVLGFGNSHKGRDWRGIDTEFSETTAFLRKLFLTMDQFIFLKQIMDENRNNDAGIQTQSPVVRRFTARKKSLTPELLAAELRLINNTRNQTVRDVRFEVEHNFRIGMALKQIRALNETLRRHNLQPEIGSSIDFQKGLGDMIILLYPMTPSLCAELWSGFCAYADPCLASRYRMQGQVFDQSFPLIDPDFETPISIKYDDKRMQFVDNDILCQKDEHVVRDSVFKFLHRTLDDFSIEKTGEAKVNFLSGVKAVVRIRTQEYMELKAKKKKKNRKKKDEDSDDDD